MMDFDLGKLFLVVSVLAVMAGCSGSTSSGNTATNGVDPDAPTEQPAPPDAGGDDDGEQPPGEDPAEPTTAFSASEDTVSPGQTVTLNWSSQGANSCEASGGWSGSRPVNGSAEVGPISASTTFTLSCSGDGGNSMAMISVSVLGTVSLAWQPPAENEDGSPLTDLSGYRIHYGQFSGSYDTEVTVGNPGATEWSTDLPSGEYYFAMTAFDHEGNESGYSNEVVRAVN